MGGRREPARRPARVCGGREAATAQRPQALRELTLKLLASPDMRLASSAVGDAAVARDDPYLTAGDLPELEKIAASEKTPIGVRVALISELERLGLVEGPARWARLLRETSGSDRIAVVRAVAAHPRDPVTQELIGFLASDDVLLVSAPPSRWRSRQREGRRAARQAARVERERARMSPSAASAIGTLARRSREDRREPPTPPPAGAQRPSCPPALAGSVRTCANLP